MQSLQHIVTAKLCPSSMPVEARLEIFAVLFPPPHSGCVGWSGGGGTLVELRVEC
jgi:hypothetical protein